MGTTGSSNAPVRAGIWGHARLLDTQLPPDSRLTLGEGWTPALEVPALARDLGLTRLVLKREDLNPTGSHKDRAAAYQVSVLAHRDPGLSWLVISSSGNAAIATAAYARLAGLELAAFISPATARASTERLLRFGATVFESPEAIAHAEVFSSHLNVPNLRPSTDPLAVNGFRTISWELARHVEPADALFSFVSSGASLVGMGRGFAELRAETADGDGRTWTPALHAVQGTGAHPIAGEYDPRDVPDVRGRLGALGARKTRRVGELKRLINASGGSGWIVTDEESQSAAHLLLHHGIETSLEGAACLAAARRASAAGVIGSAVIVLTGRARGDEIAAGGDVGGLEMKRIHHVDDLDTLMSIAEKMAREMGVERPPTELSGPNGSE